MPEAHPPQTALSNIEAIVRLEEEAEAARSLAHRISEAIGGFAGTLSFVVVHLAVLALWIVVNLGLLPGVPVFDPYPFSLLSGGMSMEAVLLTAFVLLKQNRMSNRSDRRSHLDLQINLLSEREITKVIQMLDRMSRQLGMETQVTDSETRELGETTKVDKLARELHQSLDQGPGSARSEGDGRERSGAAG